jgi:hypothetical protein
MHREPPLDDQVREKSGHKSPEAPNSSSELASLGVGFERECVGKRRTFSRA